MPTVGTAAGLFPLAILPVTLGIQQGTQTGLCEDFVQRFRDMCGKCDSQV